MIKNSLKGELHVSGHPAEVAAEFEDIARTARESFCINFGEACGMALFEKCIQMSRMSEEESIEYAAKELEKHRTENPEVAKAVDARAEELWKRIFER